MQLSRYMKLVEMGYSSSGITVCADTADAEGVLFFSVPATTVGHLWELVLSHGDSTGSLVACSTALGLASTAAERNVMAIDVHKPRQRYVAATLSATADCECRLFAFTYGLRANVGTWTPTNVNSSKGGLGYSSANGLVKRVVSPSSTG